MGRSIPAVCPSTAKQQMTEAKANSRINRSSHAALARRTAAATASLGSPQTGGGLVEANLHNQALAQPSVEMACAGPCAAACTQKAQPKPDAHLRARDFRSGTAACTKVLKRGKELFVLLLFRSMLSAIWHRQPLSSSAGPTVSGLSLSTASMRRMRLPGSKHEHDSARLQTSSAQAQRRCERGRGMGSALSGVPMSHTIRALRGCLYCVRATCLRGLVVSAYSAAL